MRETTIARNYAETLLELAQKAGDLRGWGGMLDTIAVAVDTDRRLHVFLETPRVVLAFSEAFSALSRSTSARSSSSAIVAIPAGSSRSSCRRRGP